MYREEVETVIERLIPQKGETVPKRSGYQQQLHIKTS
jgi:hypothetical protein